MTLLEEIRRIVEQGKEITFRSPVLATFAKLEIKMTEFNGDSHRHVVKTIRDDRDEDYVYETLRLMNLDLERQ